MKLDKVLNTSMYSISNGSPSKIFFSLRPCVQALSLECITQFLLLTVLKNIEPNSSLECNNFRHILSRKYVRQPSLFAARKLLYRWKVWRIPMPLPPSMRHLSRCTTSLLQRRFLHMRKLKHAPQMAPRLPVLYYRLRIIKRKARPFPLSFFFMVFYFIFSLQSFGKCVSVPRKGFLNSEEVQRR